MKHGHVGVPHVELVACQRCAVAAAHPFGEHPDVCPNCGRNRSRTVVNQ